MLVKLVWFLKTYRSIKKAFKLTNAFIFKLHKLSFQPVKKVVQNAVRVPIGFRIRQINATILVLVIYFKLVLTFVRFNMTSVSVFN